MEISRLTLKSYEETLEALALLIAEYDQDDIPEKSIPFRNKVYAINVLLGGYKGKKEMNIMDELENLKERIEALENERHKT